MSSNRGRTTVSKLVVALVAIGLGLCAGTVGASTFAAAAPNPPNPSNAPTTITSRPAANTNHVRSAGKITSGPGGFVRAVGGVHATKVKSQRPPQLKFSSKPADSSSRATVPAPKLEVPPTPAPTLVKSWPGSSQNSQVAAYPGFPSDQAASPPDPNLAVGGNWVVEATNSALTVFQRTGSPTPNAQGASCPPAAPNFVTGQGTFTLGGCNGIDLNNFVGAEAPYSISDPRVLYDQGSGIWYLSLFAYCVPTAQAPSLCSGRPADAGNTQSVVVLAHSQTSDPTGAWYGYFIPQYYQNTLTDQPRIGYSADKVAITWGEDEYTPSGPVWDGEEVLVFGKSGFLTNQANPLIWPSNGVEAAPETSYFSEFPIPETTSGVNDLYIVANNASLDLPGSGASPTLHVTTVQGGSPGAVNLYPSDIAMAASSAPPAAIQQGGSPIDTDDDRINNGTYSNGSVFTGFNDTCNAGSPSATTACIRYLKFTPASMSFGSGFAADYNPSTSSTQYVYYPSFGIDAVGNTYSTMTVSSSTTYPSVIGIGRGPSDIAWSAYIPVVPGAGAYTDSGARWGDYAGGAIDPAHPTDFWFANEVQLDNTQGSDWGTELGRLTYSAPSIDNLTPSAGPTAGGTTVTVNGSNFLVGSTFTIGGVSATPGVLTPDSFTFTAPAHAAGLVNATVTNSLGSSAATAGSGYVYVGLGVYVPVTPVRILDTRVGSCVQCAGGGLGPNTTRLLPVTGYAPSGVPANATSVVVNLTAVAGSQNTYLSAFPAGTGTPGTSSLNTGPGIALPNLVTVALGGGGAIDIFNAAGTIDVVADVDGYYIPDPGGPTDSGKYHPLAAPIRVCDSRGSQPTNVCNATTKPSDNPLSQGGTHAVKVTGGAGGIPSDGTARAAVMNLTAVAGTSYTALTVFPTTSGSCGSPPLASNVNVPAGIAQPNRVVVPVDAQGYICVWNALGTINFILDANGWYGNGTEAGGYTFQPLGPTRICDTRAGQGTLCSGNPIPPASTLTVQAAGIAGLPAGTTMKAVVMNATTVCGSAATYLAIYPDGQPVPSTSDINAPVCGVLANLVVVGIPNGKFDIYNAAGTDNAITDVVGWFQ